MLFYVFFSSYLLVNHLFLKENCITNNKKVSLIGGCGGFSTTNTITIIGCGAGGGTAAQFARKTDRQAEITIIEKGPYAQYSKCGLPYVLSKEIPSFSELVEFSPEWFEKAKIQVHLNTTVESINKEKKTLQISKGATKEDINYDKLIIATGARPFLPPISGLLKDKNLIQGAYTFRTIQDAQRVQQHLIPKSKAIVIGAGLIGLEVAEAFISQNVQVTLIEAEPTILPLSMDADICKMILEHGNKNLAIKTHHLVSKIIEKNSKIHAIECTNKETNETEHIDADMIIIATGVIPETSLAASIDCKIGTTGGIVVNTKCETTVPHVYAVGDCTEYPDLITGNPVNIGLGSIAVRQGIAAGSNAAGGNYILQPGVIQTRTSQFFNQEIAAVGPPIKELEEKQVVYGKFSGSSVLDYFPGGKPITIKVIADQKTGIILGAQGVGSNAAQRINTYACAIQNKMTLDDFRKMETAYAPPIAPTLDVLTLASDATYMKQQRKQRT